METTFFKDTDWLVTSARVVTREGTWSSRQIESVRLDERRPGFLVYTLLVLLLLLASIAGMVAANFLMYERFENGGIWLGVTLLLLGIAGWLWKKLSFEIAVVLGIASGGDARVLCRNRRQAQLVLAALNKQMVAAG